MIGDSGDPRPRRSLVETASGTVHRVAGPRVWRAARALYRAVRRPSSDLDGSPGFHYPADVADADAVRQFLEDSDIFGEAVAEKASYLDGALERYRVTMAFLPELPAGTHVLELGANPYFMTRLLRRRGLDVTCANFFHDGHPPRGRQVSHTAAGAEEGFEFDHFNVEHDRFPYADGEFELVLCCEILEHLPHDPTHMLAEIHRVLADGGWMVLTTPNPVRWDNLLKVVRGENPYEQLSGYGAYGRHNREYTVEELERLLEALGYDVDEVVDRYTVPLPPGMDGLPPGIRGERRGDNLFARARAFGEPRFAYPTWLYQSIQSYQRLVRDDFVVGLNDDVQGLGFHERDGDVRWTGAGPRARVLVSSPSAGTRRLSIAGRAPTPGTVSSLLLRARVGDASHEWPIGADGGEFGVSADVEVGEGPLEIVVETDVTWNDRDGRSKGVGIRRVWLGEGS